MDTYIPEPNCLPSGVMKHKKRLVGCGGIEIGVGGRCSVGEMGVML